MRPPFTREVLWIACDAALFTAGLWLVAATPVPFIGGTYDDMLFVREANALLDGRWLGAFDQLTLSKGCLYPLFLAAMAKLHAPVPVATQAIYLLSALLFSRIGTARPAATLRFALLALSPVPLDGACALLMREPLYAALTLATLATTAKVLTPPPVGWASAHQLSQPNRQLKPAHKNLLSRPRGAKMKAKRQDGPGPCSAAPRWQRSG